MQAVVTAFLRTLTLPWICRHDRGPEFTNALHQEMSTLLGVRQRVPGAHRPMEVGLGETIHREINKQITLVLAEGASLYPREWDLCLDLTHWIYMNTPLSMCPEFTARDLDRVWSLRDHVERDLVPWTVQVTAPVEDWARQVFSRYKELQGVVSRHLESDVEARALLVDRGHYNDPMQWDIGERCWRKPTQAPHSKHQPRNEGPYEIVALHGYKVDLAGLDERAGESLQQVPVAELIRVNFQFAPTSQGGRSLGSVLRKEKLPQPLPGPKGRFGTLVKGALVAFRPGVDRKQLLVAEVTENIQDSRSVFVKPMKAEVTPNRVRWSRDSTVPPEAVAYKSIFREVSLTPKGYLHHSDLRAIDEAGLELMVPGREVELSHVLVENRHSGMGCCGCGRLVDPDVCLACPVCERDIHVGCLWRCCQEQVQLIQESQVPLPVQDAVYTLEARSSSLATEEGLKGIGDHGDLLCLERPVTGDPRWKQVFLLLNAQAEEGSRPVRLQTGERVLVGTQQILELHEGMRAWKAINRIFAGSAKLLKGTFSTVSGQTFEKESSQGLLLTQDERGVIAVYKLRLGKSCAVFVTGHSKGVVRSPPARSSLYVEVEQLAQDLIFEQREIPHVKRWPQEASKEASPASQKKWRKLAESESWDQVQTPLKCFVPMVENGQVQKLDTNPRREVAYKEAVMAGLGLPLPGKEVLQEHLDKNPDCTPEMVQALSYTLWNKTDAFWIKDTPQTRVRGYLHDMVVTGNPVSQNPFVKGEAADWIEEQIA